MKILKTLFVPLFILGLSRPGSTEPAAFKVLPWNGYKAAFSLTYDDGDPCHLDVAMPEMTKRHLRGTFNLIAGRLGRAEEWKKLPALGQEIGSHTLNHLHPATFSPAEEKKQVLAAKQSLEKLFGFPILTFTYPFTEITPGLKKWAQTYHFISRGGWGRTYFLTPDMEPDWGDIPSEATRTKTEIKVYRDWVDKTLATGSWFLIRIHGIEGTVTGYEPITRKIYTQFLDHLAGKRRDLWIAPFGEVGAYWMAQKILEKSQPKGKGEKTTWTWEKPANFPAGVVLKLKLKDKGARVFQGGQALKPAEGVYLVAFDAQELEITGTGK